MDPLKLKKKNSQSGIEFWFAWENYKTQDTSKEGIYVYIIYMCKCTEKGLEEEPPTCTSAEKGAP